MSLPQHIDPETPERRARAPYNFVPLPEAIVPAQPLPDRDRYDPERYTGVIHCTLTSETPLYTRAALEGREYGDRQAKDKDEFFYVDPETKEPVIPGSSLRGMLRNLVEIVSYSKPQPVTDKQLFFRTVDISSVGKAYGARMSGGNPNTQGNYPLAKAGYMERCGYTYYIRPAQEIEGTQFYRVTEQIARRVIPGLREMARPKDAEHWSPNKDYEWKRQEVWFRPVPPVSHLPESRQFYADVTELSVAAACPGDGWVRGWFIASGWVPSKKGGGKRRHWIVGPPVEDDAQRREVHDRDIEAYDELGAGLTQIIREMKMSVLPKKEGERIPCFYTFWQDSEGNERVAFGHTAMFRIPYEWSPRDLLPDYLRDSSVTDMAEAIFGWVDDRKGRTIAGRVYVGDAHVTGQTGSLFEVAPHDPPIRSLLSGPKPTTFQHYLTQDDEDPLELHHYGEQERNRTTLRGHKLYWHKDDRLARRDFHDARARPDSTQHTSLRPVAKGVTFDFDVRFENLAAPELGVLLWGLHVGDQDGFRLKIGMGKPLGLGSVRTHPQLNLSQRLERYQQLRAEWLAPADPAAGDIDRFVTDFEKALWAALPEEAKAGARDFRSLPRIQALRHLLHWHGPDPDATRYMNLDAKEYKDRPVLPTPAEVMHLAPPRPLPRAAQTEEIPAEEVIVESRVLAFKEKHVELKLESGTKIALPFEELPDRVRDRWHAERLYPKGSPIRIKLWHNARGQQQATGKGVPQ